jgi:hypothetical protein
MEWVLIIMIVGWPGAGGAAVDHVEFNTKEACEAAKVELSTPSQYSSTYVCVPRG